MRAYILQRKKHFLKKMMKNNNIFFLLSFLVLVIVYLCFNINYFSWPAYLYALGVDGSFDIREEFFANNPLIMKYNAFSIYPIKKPLIYFSVYLLRLFFGLFDMKISSIYIFNFLGILSGILAAYFIYKLMYKLTSDSFFSLLFMFFISFSNVYWYQALNGELKHIAFLMLLITTYYFICFLLEKNLEHKKKIYNIVVLFFVLSFAVRLQNLAHIIVIIIALVVFLNHELLKSKFYNYFSTLFIFTLLGFSIFYIIPAYFFLNIQSFAEFFNSFSHYWNKPLYGIYGLQLCFYALFQSIIYGNSWLMYLFKLLFFFFVAISFFCYFFRKKNRYSFLFLLWFLVFFVQGAVILKQYNELSLQLYLVMPLFSFVFLNLRENFNHKHLNKVLIFFVFMVFTSNYYYDIASKINMPESKLFFIAQYKEKFSKTSKIALLLDEDYHNYWYLINKLNRTDSLFITRDYLTEKKLDDFFPDRYKGDFLLLTNNDFYIKKIEKMFSEKKINYRQHTVFRKFKYNIDKSYIYISPQVINNLNTNKQKYIIYFNKSL